MALTYSERPATGDAEGLLVLHHGRGSDENDLLALADGLDPEQRLHVVSPRAPLTLDGFPGYHWYVVPNVGTPDPETFHASYKALAEFHDEVWARTGVTPDRTILGGFSMGCVMSYSLGLGPDRPTVAGLLCFSGFIPEVTGWKPDLARHAATRALVSHGRKDQVMNIGFARDARETLEAGGIDLTYQESEIDHQIDPAHLRRATSWVAEVLPPTTA